MKPRGKSCGSQPSAHNHVHALLRRSYGEMADAARTICAAVSIPIIGDGDTGYGNAVNVKRTVRGYHQAGLAGIMIEDQVAPKRCGHVAGKQVVGFEEAVQRVQAACHARDECCGGDILVMARTDALHTHGLVEAIRRMKAFADAGADILFLEALTTREEMETFCAAVPGIPKMANLIEGGATPMLPTDALGEIGFKVSQIRSSCCCCC
jgi:2-methylisocitrate lyase-like PEP mutase family enzyme